MNWQPIETAPHGKNVLIAYTRENRKKQSVIKARYIDKFTEKASDENYNVNYNEADDTYYIPEGWYEVIENWDEWSSVKVFGEVTHWMLLPELPEGLK